MSKSNKEEIKEKVNKVALEMILKYGLKGLNMIELARECGLAKATLYKIIGSKEELINQIALKIFEFNTNSLLAPLLEISDALLACKEFLENYFNYGVKSQRMLVIQIYKEYPLIERQLDADFEKIFSRVIEVFKKWQTQKQIRSDVNIDYCIEAMMALNDYYIASDYSTEEIINRLRTGFRCILNGMGIEV